ncbi:MULTISPECIES: glycine zipper 2TM domain-containing protein [Telluria group]|uniref:Outer membrane lipoprotein SlyB n=1 Tax=Pseudoduganella violacea TaxID=1715466 RepID=A0A7W5FU37_9BURK|nr:MULTISPECIES: glycine zipper 2TM domain-containing protein [Telluria group]MBB3119434.1 outer membrane lipoprotein SlyB [Pseudoduganella violacea]
MNKRSIILPLMLALAAGGAVAQPGKASPKCNECGTVTSVQVTERDGEGGAVGMIAGGVAGALLGNQVGGGTGRKLATVAGAAGGAYAGKQIEGKVNKVKTWNINVRYNNGKTEKFSFDHDPGMLQGDRVKKANNTIVRN